MSDAIWRRFGDRLMEGNDQDHYLRDWAILRGVCILPFDQAFEALKARVAPGAMSDDDFAHFCKAMILVNATYAQHAGLAGVTDPEEWTRRYNAYVNGPDPDGRRYDCFVSLRMGLAQFRPAPALAPPYSPYELQFSHICLALFNELAVPLGRAVPGLESAALVGELEAWIGRYRALLHYDDVVTATQAGTQARDEAAAAIDTAWDSAGTARRLFAEHAEPAQPGLANRARKQAVDAMAEAGYAAGRVCLIRRDYEGAGRFFAQALAIFTGLGDGIGQQFCRRQLGALRILASGDVDAEIRANLETLTRDRHDAGSLGRAKALVSQINQSVKAGDRVGVDQFAEAERELGLRGFPDVPTASPEQAFGLWIDGVAADLRGNDFLQQLSEAIQLHAGLWAARASQATPGAAERLSALSALVGRIMPQASQAEDDLQQRFLAAAPRPLAFVPRRIEDALRAMDGYIG